ncbi:hypothetical protein LC593_32860 [Nostoc sp. CHAB 5844]|nr:hypothetical protein [Nostoc sp. CHAB 5844]
MSQPVLELNSQGVWSQVFHESRQALVATPSGGYYPIPAFEIPFLFERHILAVRCMSTTAKATWRFGGNLSQKIQLGTGGSASPLPIADGAVIPLRVNRTRLILLQHLTSTYQLVHETPYWFKDVTLTIWEYTGIESNTTEQLIETLKIDVLRVEDKIDNL